MIGSASDSRRGGFGRQQSFILIVGVLGGLQIPPPAWHPAVLMSPQDPQAGAVGLMGFCVTGESLSGPKTWFALTNQVM